MYSCNCRGSQGNQYFWIIIIIALVLIWLGCWASNGNNGCGCVNNCNNNCNDDCCCC